MCERAARGARKSTGTALAMLGDDLLMEVLHRTPLPTRVLFTLLVCKQLQYLLATFNRSNMRTLKLFSGYNYGSWRFLTDASIEEMVLVDRERKGVSIPPKEHLTNVCKLRAERLSAKTYKTLCKDLRFESLEEAEILVSVPCKPLLEFLKMATCLRKLKTVEHSLSRRLPEIFDSWCDHHGGPPPLKSLCCALHDLGWLRKLSVEELHCMYTGHGIAQADVPSVRTLFFYSVWWSLPSNVELVGMVIASCTNVQSVTFKVHQPKTPCTALDKENGVASLRLRFPNVEFAVEPEV